MKFFVDTADTAEIRSLAASGLLDGVTTNPSLIAKSGRHILDVHRRDLRDRPRPGQRRGRRDRIRRHAGRGRVLRRIAQNVTVKLPLTPDGLRACRH